MDPRAATSTGPGPSARAGRWAVVVLAVVPVPLAVLTAVAGSVEPTGLARLCVTALVYGPLAVVATSAGRRDVALVTGALAVTSGWLALALAADDVLAAGLPGLVVDATASALRVTEAAALALLPWLIAGPGETRHRAGTAAGLAAVLGALAVSVVALVGPVPLGIQLAPWLAALLSFVAGSTALVRRWSGGDARVRRVGTWFGVGAVLLALSYGRVAVPGSPQLGWLLDAAFVMAQVFLPVGLLAAIRVAPAALTLDAVVGVLALSASVSAYLVVTALLSVLGVSTATAGAVAAGALALALGTAVRAVRTEVGALFAPPPPDARAVLALLGERVGAGRDGLADVAAALRDTWGLASVEITVAATGARGAVGRPVGRPVGVPFAAQGREAGEIRVSAAPGLDLDRDVRPVLVATAGLVGVAAQLAAVNEEVVATRRRTLGVRREERRLLHDQLHDTIAPALAGLGFAMAAADRLLASGDARFTGVVDDLRDQSTACTHGVRQLARTLLPTALDQGDLEAALEELAGSVRGDGLEIAVSARGADELGPDLQLGLYLLLAEVVLAAQRVDGLDAVGLDVVPLQTAVRVEVRCGPSSRPVVPEVGDLVRARVADLGGWARRTRPGVLTAEVPR